MSHWRKKCLKDNKQKNETPPNVTALHNDNGSRLRNIGGLGMEGGADVPRNKHDSFNHHTTMSLRVLIQSYYIYSCQLFILGTFTAVFNVMKIVYFNKIMINCIFNLLIRFVLNILRVECSHIVMHAWEDDNLSVIK